MFSSAILVVFWMQLILKIVITKVIKHIKNYLGQVITDHRLQNVHLDVFRMTISSVRTIGLPAPFLWVTEPVLRNTPTQFVRHA
jgi:hypothetical protein